MNLNSSKKIIKIIALILTLLVILFLVFFATSSENFKKVTHNFQSKTGGQIRKIQKNTKTPVSFESKIEETSFIIDGFSENTYKTPTTIELDHGMYTIQSYTDKALKTITIEVGFDSSLYDITPEEETIMTQWVQHLTLPNSKSYAFGENSLLYVYENNVINSKNTTVLTTVSENYSFGHNNNLLISDENQSISFLQFPSLRKSLELKADVFFVSPNNNLIIAQKDNEVIWFDATENKEVKRVTSLEKLQKVNWSNTNALYVLVFEKDTIWIVNDNIDAIQKVIKVKDLFALSASVFLTQTDANVFYLSANQQQQQIKLDEETIEAQITTIGGFPIIIEKTRNKYLSVMDKIYQIGMTGKKTFITTSAPIPGRIDFSYPVVALQNQFSAIFKETNGNLWVLSEDTHKEPEHNDDPIISAP